jgi:hypothetical protein
MRHHGKKIIVVINPLIVAYTTLQKYLLAVCLHSNLIIIIYNFLKQIL